MPLRLSSLYRGALLAGVLLVAACGGAPSAEPPAEPSASAVDALIVEDGAAPDSLTADSLTRAAAPPPDTLAAAPAAASDTTRTPGDDARLDSLLQAVAALRAEVAALGGAGGARARADTAARGLAAVADSAEATAGRAVEAASRLGRNAFWALVVLGLTFLAIRTTVWTLDALAERSARRRLLFKKLVPIVRIVLWAFAFYVILRGIFALDAQGLAAAAAALGFAVGFASQDLLKNIFGGLVIIFDQPFQVGDKIAVGGTYGEVVGIGLRSTRIVTPDDNLVSVPNGQVVDGQVANANAGALDCQVVVDLYLPGWVDVRRAKRIAYEAAAHSRYVFLDKPVVVNVRDEFKETFLTHLKVKAYVIDTRYEFAFASDVTETAKAEFLDAGLLRPFVPAYRYGDDDARQAPEERA